jgi:hypothetical protein
MRNEKKKRATANVLRRGVCWILTKWQLHVVRECIYQNGQAVTNRAFGACG